MKLFRIVSLLIIVVMTAAWAPARALSAAPVAPVLTAPVTGLVIPNAAKGIPAYEVTFTWTHATADQFQFQLYTSSTFTLATQVIDRNDLTGDQKSFTYTLNPNVKYFWRVRAYVTGVGSPWAAYRVISTLPNPVTAVVEPFNGVTVNTLRPTFTWQPANGATSYELQIFASSAALTSTPKLSKTGLKTPSFTLTADLAKNTQYKWRVRSRGTYGVTAWYGPGDPATDTDLYFTTPNPPAMPVLQAPASGAVLTGFTTTFNWSDAADPGAGRTLNYELQITTDKTFATVTYGGGTITTTESQFPMVAPFTTGAYYWRVRSKLTGDGIVDAWYSNWSAARIVKTLPRLEITILDELTNEPIAGATVKVGALAAQVTAGDGKIIFDTIAVGSKSVVVTVDDYLKKTVSVSPVAGVNHLLDVKMSKIPFRAVLTWGATPKDLDANLWLPVAYVDPDTLAHVRSNLLGSTTVFPYARKNLDDMNGTGPETITIQKRYPGTYVYAVFLNSIEQPVGGANPWQYSKATVKIYRGTATTPLYTASVPTNDPTGRWWHVFNLNGDTGEITMVNAIKDDQEFCLLVYDCLNGEAVGE